MARPRVCHEGLPYSFTLDHGLHCSKPTMACYRLYLQRDSASGPELYGRLLWPITARSAREGIAMQIPCIGLTRVEDGLSCFRYRAPVYAATMEKATAQTAPRDSSCLRRPRTLVPHMINFTIEVESAPFLQVPAEQSI